MVDDPQNLSDPLFLLVACVTGLAAVGALVSWWQIVHHIFARIVAGVVLVGTVVGMVFEVHRGWSMVIIAATLLAVAGGPAKMWVVTNFTIAAFAGVLAGTPLVGVWLAIAGSVAMGGVCGEMMLAHFYFVNPELERWPLRRLATISLGGLAAELALILALGWSEFWGVGAIGLALFFMLWGTSVTLIILVWVALDEAAYSGVMAATGLAYLSIMTSLGAIFTGHYFLSEQPTWWAAFPLSLF